MIEAAIGKVKLQTGDSEYMEILGFGPGWLGVNKPSGISAHNDAQSAIELCKQRLEQDKGLAEKTEWLKGRFGPAPVHRLDRETSGILLVATSKETATRLQKAFELGLFDKKYRAILKNHSHQTKDHGVWSYPLTDKAEGRKNPSGAKPDRKDCRTLYTIKRRNQYFIEIEATLETGRQHQIRRHAVLNNTPIVNDERYGDIRHKALIEKIYGVSRLMLHAETLIFPETFGKISLIAPLPEEFEVLFRHVEQKNT